MTLMTQDVLQQTLYNVMNAPMRTYPFPHFYVDPMFPPEFAREMVAQLPPKEAYSGALAMGVISDESAAKETHYLFDIRNHLGRLSGQQAEFWKSVGDGLLGQECALALLNKFWPFLQERFPGGMPNVNFGAVANLARDITDFRLGPHTDHPQRLLNLFIYLPDDDRHPELGTSFYVPKDKNMTCAGGPHYKFDFFNRAYTAPFLPNTACGFFKNDRSFHGVEEVRIPDFVRNLLGYELHIAE